MHVFYQYLVKNASFKLSALCFSNGNEFTKIPDVVYQSRVHSVMLLNFILLLWF